MATMIDGESYLGKVLIRPLSPSGDVTMYLWPTRCLKGKTGGPTFGVDIKGKEVLRFDPHGLGGHWHKGGYDLLGAGGSHQEFPDDEKEAGSASQVTWCLGQIEDQVRELLAEAGYPDEAASLDQDLIETATTEASDHLAKEDSYETAIAMGLIAA